jgi:hypothetical protein
MRMESTAQISLGIGLWLAFAFLFPSNAESAEVLQRIRIGVPSVALTYMPFYVAQEKGFSPRQVSKRNTSK